MEVDEAPLLAGVAASQLDWAAIYTTYRADMMRTAISVLGPRSIRGEDAEDVVTKVMTELMRKGLPTDVRNLRGFLVSVTRRRSIDVSRGRRFDEVLEDHQIEASEEDDLVGDAAVTAALVDQGRAALARLEPKERHAVEQRFLLQRPAKDVAAEIDVSPQYLPKLIRKGLARLRAEIGFTDHPSFDQEVSRSTESGDPGGPR